MDGLQPKGAPLQSSTILLLPQPSRMPIYSNNKIHKVDVSIITDPIPHGTELITENLRKFVRMAWDFKSLTGFGENRYRGHHAVTRSLVEGLEETNFLYNYNPTSVGDLGNTVIVLSGVRTLRQAIALKQKGYFKSLYAGPNIVTFPSDHNSVLASPEVDAAIVPSSWVLDLYTNDLPSLEGRCLIWPAGVDTRYWRPDPAVIRDQILVYEKRNTLPQNTVELVSDYIKSKGYRVSVLRYGSYTHEEYLINLQKSLLMVGFGCDSESQGIAWSEAWATDVPTMIRRNNTTTYRGKTFKCSTAPYLNPKNGTFFDDFEDMRIKFAEWENDPSRFSPRGWVIENMSDTTCACRLFELISRR